MSANVWLRRAFDLPHGVAKHSALGAHLGAGPYCTKAKRVLAKFLPADKVRLMCPRVPPPPTGLALASGSGFKEAGAGPGFESFFHPPPPCLAVLPGSAPPSSQIYVIELDGRNDGDAIQDALLEITGGRWVTPGHATIPPLAARC